MQVFCDLDLILGIGRRDIEPVGIVRAGSDISERHRVEADGVERRDRQQLRAVVEEAVLPEGEPALSAQLGARQQRVLHEAGVDLVGQVGLIE